MKNHQVHKILKSWTNKIISNTKNLTIEFSEQMDIGNGFIEHLPNDTHFMTVGIFPVSMSFLSRNQNIDESDFIIIGNVFFHESAHYDQKTDPNTSTEILLSDLSKVGNPYYYKVNWPRFPHEIDADFSGTMSMWENLKVISPKHADDLMLKRITKRAATTNYIFKKPKDGFKSQEQIEKLFEKAYDDSLAGNKRTFPAAFLRSDDEIAQLLTNEDHTPCRDYVPFYQSIIKSKTGAEMDHKMASLVSYLHPELQNLYPGLDFKELNPKTVFGMTMPETYDEIWNHINQNTTNLVENQEDLEFADAVAALTKSEVITL